MIPEYDDTLTPDVADQYVAAGSALITSELGEGWVSKVDRETFDITDPDWCLAPQVFGKPFYQVEDLLFFNDSKRVISHGFDVYTGCEDRDGAVLNEAWNREFDRLSA